MQHIEKVVDHGRVTNDMLMQSCFKAKERERKLMEQLLKENQELRERDSVAMRGSGKESLHQRREGGERNNRTG